MVCFTVFPHHTGPVQGKKDRQLLQADIMNNLVIGPLQKSRINGYNRPIAGAGQAGGKGNGVLLGYTNIKKTLRELPGKKVQSRARRHGGGYCQYFFIFFGKFNQ